MGTSTPVSALRIGVAIFFPDEMCNNFTIYKSVHIHVHVYSCMNNVHVRTVSVAGQV